MSFDVCVTWEIEVNARNEVSTYLLIYTIKARPKFGILSLLLLFSTFFGYLLLLPMSWAILCEAN